MEKLILKNNDKENRYNERKENQQNQQKTTSSKSRGNPTVAKRV